MADTAIRQIPRSGIAISKGRWFVISVEIFKSPFQRGGPFRIPPLDESLVSHSFRVDRESRQLFSMLPGVAQRQHKEPTWSKGQHSSNFQESMAQD